MRQRTLQASCCSSQRRTFFEREYKSLVLRIHKMLRAMRKFAFKRDTGTGQASEGVVEKNEAGSQANNSDDALQSAGKEFEEPSGPPVRGTVKWLSPIKGYGFVVLSDGSGD